MDSAAATSEELRVAATDNTRRGGSHKEKEGTRAAIIERRYWDVQASQTKGSYMTGVGREGTAQAEDRWATAR